MYERDPLCVKTPGDCVDAHVLTGVESTEVCRADRRVWHFRSRSVTGRSIRAPAASPTVRCYGSGRGRRNRNVSAPFLGCVRIELSTSTYKCRGCVRSWLAETGRCRHQQTRRLAHFVLVNVGRGRRLARRAPQNIGLHCVEMDGRMMRCGIISSCQSAASSEIVNLCWLRVYTHVSERYSKCWYFAFFRVSFRQNS